MSHKISTWSLTSKQHKRNSTDIVLHVIPNIHSASQIVIPQDIAFNAFLCCAGRTAVYAAPSIFVRLPAVMQLSGLVPSRAHVPWKANKFNIQRRSCCRFYRLNVCCRSGDGSGGGLWGLSVIYTYHLYCYSPELIWIRLLWTNKSILSDDDDKVYEKLWPRIHSIE